MNETPFPEYDKPTEESKASKQVEGFENTPPQNSDRDTAKKSGINSWITLALALVLAVLSFFAGTIYSRNSGGRAERLAKWIVNTIEKNSIYANEMTEEQWIALIDGMGKGAISSGFIDSGIDVYSDFYSPAEVQAMMGEFTDGSRAGMGVQFVQDGDYVKLVNVVKNSPADSFVGVDSDNNTYSMQKGDRFYAVRYYADESGNPVSKEEGELVTREFYGKVSANELGTFFAFPEQYHFTLVMNRADAEGNYGLLLDFEAWISYYVPRFSTYYDSDSLSVLPQDTALIRLESFDKPSASDFIKSMNLFRNAGKKHLILDVRTNGGGLVNECQTITSYLVKDDKNSGKTFMAYDRYADNSEKKYYTQGNYYDDYFGADSRIVVLADGNSASATELMLMTMRYYGTVDAVFGENTYGKGISQRYFFENPLKSTGFCLKITISQLFNPDHVSIHEVGIAPDFVVKQTEKSGVTSDDETIQKALAWLSANA